MKIVDGILKVPELAQSFSVLVTIARASPAHQGNKKGKIPNNLKPFEPQQVL